LQPSELERLAAAVAGAGTDPRLLVRILAWWCGPRRDPDQLRRRLRDGAASTAGPGPTLATLVGDPDRPLREVAALVLGRWARRGVRACVVGDPTYPRRLAEGWPVTDGPVVLAWRGTPPADAAPGVAIVGSRRISDYGRDITAWLAASVSRAGARVVSGGAVGVDAVAHEAALELPGGTTVVLGCGHDVPYPAMHARRGGLFDRVLEDGGTLLCELLPEVRPHPGVIRARNRILAGLAEVVVVVEGGARSGALITAGAAAERGREVLAVPGDVRAPGSVAPLRLLAEGAAPCTGPADVLALLPRPSGPGPSRGSRPSAASPDGPGDRSPVAVMRLPDAVAGALAAAWPRPVSVDELARRSGEPPGALLAALTRARLAGEVEELHDGVRLTRPSVR
jgi:DNA processing protein